jgi:hypothetical protein
LALPPTSAARIHLHMPPPPPPSVGRQVAEIAAEPDRATAYARLLHLQRACADDPSAAADLAAASPSALLPDLLRDGADHDEEVAASALKCLGFALYHPVLVSTISGISTSPYGGCPHISRQLNVCFGCDGLELVKNVGALEIVLGVQYETLAQFLFWHLFGANFQLSMYPSVGQCLTAAVSSRSSLPLRRCLIIHDDFLKLKSLSLLLFCKS